MKLFITITWFLIFTKALFFWLWLWQLKEYHFGRFRAHFETQKIKKVISSFHWIKFPKFTKKTIIVSSSGILLEILILFYLFSLPTSQFYFFLLVFLILSPLISSLLVLLFQIPTVMLRNRILKKAQRKIAKFSAPGGPASGGKNLIVIGITGSYGKTSTKEFLATILSEKFNVLKTKEHQNSEVGISQCVLNNLKEDHEVFVVEMGAYNRGGIKLLCDITKPKIGILTGINEQHMATFGSQENIIKTKFELIESLPEDGIAFFNARNKYCVELYKKPLLRQGFGGQAKIRKFLYGERATFRGEENILGAMAVAKELGMTEEEISRAIGKIKNKFGGIQIKKGINGLNIIDAAYSANPDGAIAHLEYLKTFPGKKVIVMPCLIELGKASGKVHKRIGKKIGEVCDLAIITTKDRFKEIKDGAGDKAVFMEDPKAILEKIKNFTKEGDLVLLESRVPDFLIKQLIL